ncbi:uncharacterized protein A4U43_C07F14290 [Asparagus officinalis]|uniref:Uncharacterized protein n=1 Tax=Asparagus officinalis TaxID=4686 RepID=A0A5P1EC55_ASPOF|nr:uncharacterized protein A4U43_C07F14290 [Asparagus officinalis]
MIEIEMLHNLLNASSSCSIAIIYCSLQSVRHCCVLGSLSAWSMAPVMYPIVSRRIVELLNRHYILLIAVSEALLRVGLALRLVHGSGYVPDCLGGVLVGEADGDGAELLGVRLVGEGFGGQGLDADVGVVGQFACRFDLIWPGLDSGSGLLGLGL